VKPYSVRNVSFGYHGGLLFRDFNMTLESAELLGVIGPNGSGKTTLLKLLTGVNRVSQGSIKLLGNDVAKLSRAEIAKSVAVVSQDQPQDFVFSVEEMVMMGRLPHVPRWQWEGSKDWELAREAMILTGVDHLIGRNFNQLSGGERQRVIIARALAQEPKVLLLDEPTAHLDLQYQGEILDLVWRLRKEIGLAVLLVMHDLSLAGQYMDRLIMLKKGKVLCSGTPKEVLTAKNIREGFNREVDVFWSNGHPHISIKAQVLV